jgi:hypothetical protein
MESRKRKEISPMNLFTHISCISFGILLMTGCANVLTEMSDKDSDKAKLFDARAAIDKGSWTTALTKISEMSTTFQTQRDSQVLKASAYAGRCGLDILQMITNISGNASTNLFSVLMKGMAGSTATNVADCIAAENVLKSISTMPSTDKKENLLMALTSLTKIGAILAQRGDANVDGVLDWSRSGTFPCDATTGTTALPVADVNEIGTGFVLFLVSMGAFGTSGASSLDALTAFCTSVPAGAPASLCSMTDTSAFNGVSRNYIRRLVEQTTGVGLSICTGDCMVLMPNDCADAD